MQKNNSEVNNQPGEIAFTFSQNDFEDEKSKSKTKKKETENRADKISPQMYN